MKILRFSRQYKKDAKRYRNQPQKMEKVAEILRMLEYGTLFVIKQTCFKQLCLKQVCLIEGKDDGNSHCFSTQFPASHN